MKNNKNKIELTTDEIIENFDDIINNIPMPELSEEEVAEITRRMDDFDNPVRYYIESTLLSKMFYDIQLDCWSSCRKDSTGFKRKCHAELIQSQMTTKDRTIITEYDNSEYDT